MTATLRAPKVWPHLTRRCSRPAAVDARRRAAQRCAAGLLSGRGVRQCGRAIPRLLGLATVILLLLAGCFMATRSLDSTVADNLQLSLYASTGYYSTDNVSFELFFNSSGDRVWPGGREIAITANDVPLAAPRSWSIWERFGPVSREVNYGYRRCSLWHLSHARLAEWLGGPGRYSVRVQVGPAASNEVVLEYESTDHVTIVSPGKSPRPRN